MNTMVIGIAGGTGSGKTTVTEKLQEYFGADVSVLHHDSYYKRHDELPFEKRKLLNYDHPDSFDTSLLIEDLRSLNGTWVDGAIVSRASLRDGSTVQIGTFRMVFHTNARPRRIQTEA